MRKSGTKPRFERDLEEKQGSWTSKKLLQSGQDFTLCYSAFQFLRLSVLTRSAQPARRRETKNAINTSVLGMVAKGMDACDSFPCSTSLRSMLYNEAKIL